MIAWLIQRPVAVLLSATLLILLGIAAAGRLPVELLPPFEAPRLRVQAGWPGHSAYEMENRAAAVLRSRLATLPGLDDLESVAREGSATLLLSFRWGTDMRLAYLRLNEQIDALRPLLPPDMERPATLRADAADIPLMQLVCRDATLDETGLRSFAQDILRRRFEQLPGIAFCEVSGGAVQELRISPDPARLRAAGTNIAELTAAVQAANYELGALRFREGQYEYSLELSRSLRGPAEVEALPLRSGGRLFRLGDLAKVELRASPRNTFVLDGQEEAVWLSLYPQQESNLLESARGAHALLEEMPRAYPGLSLKIADDQSEFVGYAVRNLGQNVALGMLLAMGVLFLFMGAYREPLLMAATVPVSLLLTAGIFYALGLSVNLLTLAGLAIGTGVLVDNGIIVVEQIERLYRRRLAGEPGALPDAEIASGAGGMAAPMLASALTTICVFVPLVFSGGLAGVFFKEQAMAIAISLGASLAVSLLLLPVLYRLMYRRGYRPPAGGARLPERLSGALLALYDRALRLVLDRPGIALGVAAACLGAGLFAAFRLPQGFFPEVQSDRIELHLNWEPGLGLEANRQRCAALAARAAGLGGVQQVYALGGAISRRQEAGERGPQQAILLLQCPAGPAQKAVQQALQSALSAEAPAAQWSWQQPPNALSGVLGAPQPDWELRVSAARESLISAAELDSLLHWLHRQPEVGSASAPYGIQLPAWEISPKMTELLRYGITPEALYSALENLFGQARITLLRDFDRSTPVLIGAELQGQDMAGLLARHTVGPNHIPISAVAAIRPVQRFQALTAGKSGLQQRIVCALKPGADAHALAARCAEWLRPMGLSPDFGGAWYAARVQNRALGGVLLLACALLYLVMAAQFESLWQPLLIVLTIPLGICGALFSLWLAGESLNLMSAIGMVVISGIVVNDSILKIDAINHLQRKGVPLREALLEAGHERFRAILLTMLTTVLSVMPILWAGGAGGDVQRPLSIAIAGGIFVDTLASLLVMPAMYLLWAKARQRSHPQDRAGT